MGLAAEGQGPDEPGQVPPECRVRLATARCTPTRSRSMASNAAFTARTNTSMSDRVWKGLPLGAEGVRLPKEQFPAALYIKAGFDAGFLRYTCFLAEKG